MAPAARGDRRPRARGPLRAEGGRCGLDAARHVVGPGADPPSGALGQSVPLRGRRVLRRGRRRRALDQPPAGRARAPGAPAPRAVPGLDRLGRIDPRQLFRPPVHGRQSRPAGVRPNDARALFPGLRGDGVGRSPSPGPGRALDARRGRLLRRERRRVRALQGVDGPRLGARARPRAGAGAPPPRRGRERRPPQGDLETRRSVLPHERHRGGDGRPSGSPDSTPGAG